MLNDLRTNQMRKDTNNGLLTGFSGHCVTVAHRHRRIGGDAAWIRSDKCYDLLFTRRSWWL